MPWRSYPVAKNNRKGSGSSKLCLEAPGGFEPLHRSFADCSLSHLGTAPRAHYSGPCSDISTYTLKGLTNRRV